jgi:hypothetical protein
LPQKWKVQNLRNLVSDQHFAQSDEPLAVPAPAPSRLTVHRTRPHIMARVNEQFYAIITTEFCAAAGRRDLTTKSDCDAAASALTLPDTDSQGNASAKSSGTLLFRPPGR